MITRRLWKKYISYPFQALIVVITANLFRLMPVDTASNIGGWILGSVGPKLAASRKALKNLRDVMPELTDEERWRIIRGMWENMGRVYAEYPHLKSIWTKPKNGKPRVEFVGTEHLLKLIDDGKPGILFSGHLGNWEVLSSAPRQHGLNAAMVYRPPNNPWVAKMLLRERKDNTDRLIAKGAEGMREMVQIMKEGGHFAMLIDQKLNTGISVPFFGRPAMTGPMVAKLALKFKCPVLPAYCERLDGATFRINIFPPMELPDTGDSEKDTLTMMTEINEMLEEWIRKDPRHWLWIHRRWPKHAPPVTAS